MRRSATTPQLLWTGIRRALGATAGAALAVMASGGSVGASGLAHLTAATASDLYVAVVVDFGGANGAPGDIATCVKVPPGSTDADALTAAVGSGNLGYAPSGLLCVIDGVPQSGIADCNATSGGEYYFWSYWNGTAGSWSYASRGPAATLVTPGDVEGWRYQNPGPANASAPSPATAADFSRICPAEYVSSPGATTTTSLPASGGHTPAPAAAGGPAAAPTTTTSATASGPTKPATSRGTPTTTSPRSAPALAGHPTTTTPSRVRDRAPPAGSNAADGSHAAHALGPTAHPSSPGSNWLVPLLVGLLVVGLGVAAAIRWRRRPVDTQVPEDP